MAAVHAALGLVGDIGGTNCRLAVVELNAGPVSLRAPRSYLCAHFETASACIQAYLKAAEVRPLAAVLAVAGPVLAGSARLTNNHWQLVEAALGNALGLPCIRLINDFAALAFAAPLLDATDTATIGPDIAGAPRATIAVMGPGTGFGLAALAGGAASGVIATEGGHIAYAPTDETEQKILHSLARRHGRVSIERILAGQGLADLHAALAEIDGRAPPDLTAAAITAAAAAGDPVAAATVDRFCAILGATTGDLALALGAQGGVFIAGGIAPRLLGALRAGQFRARFEAKGRFAAYMQAIPTRVITVPHAALLGAADELARLTAAQA